LVSWLCLFIYGYTFLVLINLTYYSISTIIVRIYTKIGRFILIDIKTHLMHAELIAVIITLIFGPVVFWIWSHIIYKNSSLKKFPIGYHDSIGDIILLPLFNAISVHLGILKQEFMIGKLILSLIGGLLLLLFFIIHRRNNSGLTDWSIPQSGMFNAGGWYHALFMVLQSVFILYSLLSLSYSILLWAPLFGFIIVIAIQWIVEKKSSNGRN